MGFKKGQSGNPGGRPKDKPFRNALEMEIKAAGEDGKQLRKIARALLKEAETGNMTAINMVADRLDGRPPQTVAVTDDDRRDIDDWSDDELLGLLARRNRGNGTEAPGGSKEPDSVH